VKADDTFCSPQCEEVSCSRCQGRLETREVEKEVFDLDRAVEMHYLSSILQAQGVMHPPPFEEQLHTYHPQCRSKVSCCMACDGCQSKHFRWFDQHLEFQTFGDKPLIFWLRNEDRFEELHQLPRRRSWCPKRLGALGVAPKSLGGRRSSADAFDFCTLRSLCSIQKLVEE
jgi:hypothetical protein